jgi:hypothetical protein
MADEDEALHDLDADEEFEPELIEEIDPEELDEEALVEEDVFEDELVEDDEFGAEEDGEDDLVDDLADAPVRRPAPAKEKDSEEEDDDDDMITPDDVEADLDTILKDRLIANESELDEDEDGAEVDDPRAEPGDRLQPKRPDEQLCSSCFLLVRAKAPGCPMDDDTCPIFS